MKKKSLTSLQSSVIKNAIFFATLFVVFRHGQNLHHYYENGSPYIPISDLNIFIQEFINRITECAIPCFFMISGFLFFINLSSISEIKVKLIKRIRTLLIPYMLWNLLLLALVVTVYFFLPSSRNQLIKTYNFSLHFLWFIDNITIHPIVGQFWYIRTLLFFCCLSPIFFLLYRNKICSFLLLVPLFCFWKPIDCSLISSEGLLFYYVGGMIGYNKWNNFIHLEKLNYSYIFIPISFTIFTLFIVDSIFFSHIRVLLLICSLFSFSYFVADIPKIQKIVDNHSKYLFYIYAMHGVIVSGVSLFFSKIVYHTAFISFFAYWISIVITLFVIYFFAINIKNLCPVLSYLLTGGR